MRCRSNFLRVTLSILISGTSSGTSASIIHYVSFGMPDQLLRKTIEASGKDKDARIIFKGLPKVGGYPAFIRQLIPLVQGLPKNVIPHIGIDPSAFEHANIREVPVVKDDEGHINASGTRYPVIEIDPRVSMKEKLRNIPISQWREYLLRDQPKNSTRSLPKATTENEFTLQPEFRLARSIVTAKGDVLAEGGLTVNALDFVSFPFHLLILDMNDPSQVDAIRNRLAKLEGKVMVMGVGAGRPDERMVEGANPLPIPIYPVPERWIEQLRLSALPAEVNVEGDHLKVHQWRP